MQCSRSFPGFPFMLICALTLLTPQRSFAQTAPGFFRCDIDGRTHYQAAPCADARTQVPAGGGTFTLVEPPQPATATSKATPLPRGAGAPARADDAAKARRGAAAERIREERAKRAERCAYHRRAIDMIDAKARQRSTPRLAEQRRKHTEALWSLECGSL